MITIKCDLLECAFKSVYPTDLFRCTVLSKSMKSLDVAKFYLVTPSMNTFPFLSWVIFKSMLATSRRSLNYSLYNSMTAIVYFFYYFKSVFTVNYIIESLFDSIV